MAIFLPSAGEVLYSAFLHDVSPPLFVVLSVCETALVFLAVTKFCLPSKGRWQMVQTNVWTRRNSDCSRVRSKGDCSGLIAGKGRYCRRARR
jgi:hypothetical protein